MINATMPETIFQTLEPSEMIVWNAMKIKGDEFVVARINTCFNTGKQILVAREKGHEILGIVTINPEGRIGWVNAPPPDVRDQLEMRIKCLYSDE